MKSCTILGGPRDGDIVGYTGPVMELAIFVAPRNLFDREAADIPSTASFRSERYYARQDLDGRWFYVREGILE